MLTAGTIVAGHRIEKLLGEGGMAAVYEAHQVSLNRVVALKVLTRRVGDDADFRERFRRECQIQARFDHPNIVPVYEAGESEYGLWLTMRLVRGMTLRELLLTERLGPGRTLQLLGPIAGALDVAHDHGLIHRDITPQNILVDERDHPYLADFGITKSRGDRSLTRTGQFVGTLDYVAPEQIQDEATSAATDIYSLTAILFECLTGRVPYDKQSEAAVLFAHIADDPPRATGLEPSLPEAIDPVLRRGLAKAPADRYGSATELIAAAKAALAQAGEGAAPEARRPVAAAVDRAASTRTGMAAPPPPPVRAGRASSPAGDEDSRAPTRPMGIRRLLQPLPASLLAALLGLAALAVGLTSGGEASTAEGSSAAAGPLRIEAPAGWTGEREQPAIPGMRLDRPLTLAPPERSGRGAIVVGVSPATGKALLPLGFARTGEGRVGGVPVSLGPLEALRYAGLESRGSQGPMTVFASPASIGVATVLCLPPARAPQDFFELCQRAASTLRLARGEAFPLGPSPQLASVLRRRVSALAERRGKLRRRLEGAGSSKAQASAAADLATAFRQTARALSSREVTPQSAAGLAAVVEALRSTRDAYKDLASAAGRERSAAYRAVAAKVNGSESEVDERLLAMRRLGYRIGSEPLAAPGEQGAGEQGEDEGEAG